MNVPRKDDDKAGMIEHAVRDVSKEERAELMEVWKDVSVLEPTPYSPRPEKLRQIRGALLDACKPPANPAVSRRRTTGRWIAAAACVAACLVGAYYWLAPVSLTTTAGMTASFDLPDGSVAEMNQNTSLTYRRWVGRRTRHLSLDGEAFFDVRPGARPFVVETRNARITVEGTRFNVRATESSTAVYVVEGEVRLDARGKAVLLGPGQRSRVDYQGGPSRAEVGSVSEILEWRVRTLAFRNEPLREIFEKIARQYHVTVSTDSVSDDALLSQRLTYVAPRTMNAEALISDMCRITRLKYRVMPNGYQIVQPDAP